MPWGVGVGVGRNDLGCLLSRQGVAEKVPGREEPAHWSLSIEGLASSRMASLSTQVTASPLKEAESGFRQLSSPSASVSPV